MSNQIFQEILKWSADLQPWQNEAIRRMLQKGVLSPSDKEELFSLAQVCYGLVPPGDKIDFMLKAEDFPSPTCAGEKIKLHSVGKLVSVNMLKPDEHISVGSQLTVVYGENGSGKSGYARVMKKAFRARAVEPILPNVYDSAATGPAKAMFEIEEGGVKRNEEWQDGVPSNACLGRFSVFDSKCARAYVTENNQLEFVPFGLDIVEAIGSVTNEFKKRLQDAAAKASPNSAALAPLVDKTSIGQKIASVNATSNEDEFKSLAVWTEANQQLLTEKEARIVQLKANSPATLKAALLSQKRNIEGILSAISVVESGMSPTVIGKIETQISTVETLAQAVSAAAKLAFSDPELPGIGGEYWRELLNSAARFSANEAYPSENFPVVGDDSKCVLCMQPLDDKAKTRLTRFWDFIQNDVSAKRDAAELELNRLMLGINKIPKALPKDMELLAEGVEVRCPGIVTQLREYYESNAVRIKAIADAVTNKSWADIPKVSQSPLATCRQAINELEVEIGAIKDDKAAADAISVIQSEIDELNAKQRLFKSLPLVLTHIAALRKTALLSGAASKITTNSISAKASELHKKYVTEEYRKRIEAELEPLGLSRVRAGLDKKTEKGKVLHRVTVAGASGVNPESVFSEGERTAVSMACFLAELSASHDNCGIILDDPLSSLDHRIREALVSRLVAEAQKRQVIIFTHDLVFYRELLGEADRQKVFLKVQNVESLGTWTGIVSNNPPWDAMKVGARISFLEGILKTAKESEVAGDVIKYKGAYRDFYGYLRSTWERSVEELLFCGVIERLEPEVKTKRLTGVSVDVPAVTAVFEGMANASSKITAHDHAAAKNTSLPAYAELSKDLESLKTFVKQQKEKIKASDKNLEHLK